MNTLPSNMSSPAGIASVHMGNPAPLAQKVQQAGTQPNGLPNDLLDALALQQVAMQQEAAKRQMMLQQQAPQGTILDRLKQQVVGNEKQKLMAAMAPQGLAGAQPQQSPAQGGVDQLPSNVGQNFAGGGIVAFNGEDSSEVKGDTNSSDDSATMPARFAAWQAEKVAQLRHALGLDTAVGRSGVMRAARQQEANAADVSGTDLSMPVRSDMQPNLPLRSDMQPDLGGITQAYAVQPSGPVIPSLKSMGVRVGGGDVANTPFTDKIQKGILDLIAQDPDAARQKQAEWFKGFVGADKELQGLQGAIDARKAEYEKGKALRDPTMEFLRGIAGAKAGLPMSMQFGAGGERLYDTKQNWNAADIANLDKLYKDQQGLANSRISANTDAAKAGDTAYSDTMRNKGVGITAGAQESSRIESARIHANEMAMRRAEMLSNKEQAAYQRTHDLAMKQATDAATKFDADPANKAMNPGMTSDKLFWTTYNRAMSSVPGFNPIKGSDDAGKSGIDLSKWGTPKVKN